MSPTTCHGPDGVDLSREEAWVLHAAVLEHVERVVAADGSPDRSLTVLDRIESCAPLDAADRDVVREALSTYDAPDRDRASVEAIRAALPARRTDGCASRR
ncbi:DUF7853 family protein [Haloplanus rubicundus]|uniref:Uncharacterized protein n=1 Tax=Haloplanus rubicundus TaxID=1547898 RepID=A0A345E901_9EURY|nr:hypothetical protein [Haloplanus rubicundus]AXG08673.1 hypothetical protein DU484_01705 [Haloplanus rubicundus]